MSPAAPFDAVLIGNGLAALLAAQACLKEGLRVALLNPDPDFFLEDSELALDPCFFSGEESVSQLRSRLQSSSAEELAAKLRPHFPGSIGYSTWERPGPSEHEYLETPVVRARARMWIDLRQDASWDEFALRLEEAGTKPAWVDGLTAVRKLPGASAPTVLGSVSRGLVFQGLGDVDLSRFRTGVHEFVIDRFRREGDSQAGELVLGCTGIELGDATLKWRSGKVPHVVDPSECRHGVWVFLTPRIARLLHVDVTQMPGFLGYRAQEEWTLFSREPLHLGTIGNLSRQASDLCVWAQLDGSFPKEASFFKLSILHQGPRLSSLGGAVSLDSLNPISEFCLDTLRWGSFSVRSLKTRRIFEWRDQPHLEAFSRGNTFFYSHCDGPVSGVIAQVDRVLKERVV